MVIPNPWDCGDEVITILMNTSIGELKAEYRGREYIELYLDGEQYEDIINVFDYAAGSPRIENTPDDVEKTLKEWFAENHPEIDICDITISWRRDNE